MEGKLELELELEQELEVDCRRGPWMLGKEGMRNLGKRRGCLVVSLDISLRGSGSGSALLD